MDGYQDTWSLALARDRYFEQSGITPGYDNRWVVVRAGPIPLAFPNAPGRVRAVKLHDLHHVATGYSTSWTGEAEIGAWEIAGGCAHHAWAWVLNLGAFAVGLLIAPRATFRAFQRGRCCTNLYQLAGEYDESLLERTVGQLRFDLRLKSEPRATAAADIARFSLWTTLALAYVLALPVLLLWLLL